jgi:hypothetical protein
MASPTHLPAHDGHGALLPLHTIASSRSEATTLEQAHAHEEQDVAHHEPTGRSTSEHTPLPRPHAHHPHLHYGHSKHASPAERRNTH